MIVVIGVDPDIVIVHMLVARAQGGERPAAVVGYGDIHVVDVDAVGIGGIDLDLGVILALRIGGIAALPGDAVIGGAPQAAAIGGLDLGVNNRRVGGRVVQADAAELAAVGEAAADLRPCLAGVDRAPDSGLGATVNDAEVSALPLSNLG